MWLMAISAVSPSYPFLLAGVEGMDMEGVAIAFLPPSVVFELSFTARNFLTRQPTGTPKCAINTSEGLPIHHISI
jgi:hypothetical protein